MKYKKVFALLIATSITILNFTTIASAAENTEISVKIKSVEAVNLVSANKYSKLTSEVKTVDDKFLNEISEVATVDISYPSSDTKQYTFYGKEPIAETTYDNGIIANTYLATSILTKSDETSFNSNSVTLKGVMTYERVDINGQNGYKITKATGQVVSRTEKYGKNLNIKVKEYGACGTTSGTRTTKTQGWYTATATSPTIGTTYANNHTFENYYYFCDEEWGYLCTDVTYQYSHNGSTYYTVTLQTL